MKISLFLMFYQKFISHFVSLLLVFVILLILFIFLSITRCIVDVYSWINVYLPIHPNAASHKKCVVAPATSQMSQGRISFCPWKYHKLVNFKVNRNYLEIFLKKLLHSHIRWLPDINVNYLLKVQMTIVKVQDKCYGWFLLLF